MGLKIFTRSELKLDNEIILIDGDVCRSVVEKVSKGKTYFKHSDNTPFLVITITTNNGTYNFIELRFPPKRGDVIEFTITNFDWGNAEDLKVIGTISKEELQSWNDEIKNKKQKRNKRYKELLSKIEIGVPYYHPHWGGLHKVYVPFKKGRLRVFVMIYDSFYYGTRDCWAIEKKWMYPDELSTDPIGKYKKQQEEPKMNDKEKTNQLLRMFEKYE